MIWTLPGCCAVASTAAPHAAAPKAAGRGWRRLAGAALLLAACLLSACASLGGMLGTTAPADAPPPAPARLRLVVQAPPELRSLLEKNLDLARLQGLPTDDAIDDSEWVRLIGAAPAQARDLLQTEGYFEAQVAVQRRIETLDGRPLQQVLLTVQPGPRTRIASLQVDFQGALKSRLADANADSDADALALSGPLTGAAVLRPGQPFRNPAWAELKQQWLARLRAAGYAVARLAQSQADVDVQQQQAALSLLIDSGPLFRAGPLKIEGLQHHDAQTVQNLAGFGIGDALTEVRLLDFQDRLQKAGLFESVNVSFDPTTALADASPVRVRLTELPLQQATLGLGISANSGPRATAEHTHRRPFGLAAVAHNKLEWGRDNQAWAGDFQSHPGEGFYRKLLGIQIDRLRSATDVVLSQRVRLGRTQDTTRIERLYFVEWLRSAQSDRSLAANTGTSTATNAASAISANYHWVFRQLDSVLLPTRGLTLSLQGGAGQARSQGGNAGPFGRVYGRLTGYLPLGQAWYGQARVEAGQILKASNLTVPDALGFRAGGDESVRGYAFRALAPVGTDGGTVSGRSLLTASIEVARPVSASLPNVWGALFIDAGRAVDDWRDYKPALGYGVGVRWRSPIGPLKVDLAWADELRRLRLHFSVGIAF